MAIDLLSRHRVIETNDLDRAREAVATTFCPHRLTLRRSDGLLNLVHNACAVGENVSLHYMRYGDEVHITPGRFERFFLVQVPLAGTARIRIGDRVVASDRRRASVGSPTTPVDMMWSDQCEKLVIYLRRSAVEDAARADSDDREPVIFAPTMDLATPAARSWMRLIWLAVDGLDGDGHIFSEPLVASHFEQTVISGLLSIQRNSVRPLASRPRPAPRVVRAALELIEEEPEAPWRVADLASSVGVSTRRLQELFANEVGTTPLEQIRRTRLERAHIELLGAEPSAASVTEIATRWGFFHLGRFARDYQAQYHELPSETLAR